MSSRRERVERAKHLGRLAFRLARAGTIVGNLEIDGEKKRLTEFQRGPIFIELWEPWRPDAFETEFSRLRVTYAGEKVLELRWDDADAFTLVLLKPGDWQGRVRD
ncbi:hypothetical protein UB31_18910 [Bradyrhizobium sp. LTSP849]|uniref:hypothetical protein n=1 Tax=Bradyrhizobium sp. LTSP849 TaxID=1615890 RepID=UPI0005D1A377|nr:hypothetical protein [Bradyrhizobium sp. LTSP849]KJC47326.1 hypothetical protein UB31_18910 [Bradyrhizobium sp. LTSP849]